jgi:dienelactone hydrolase
MLDGYRWQMVPVFVLTAGSVFWCVFSLRKPRAKQPVTSLRVVRAAAIGVSFILYIVSFLFPALLPVVDLPGPKGSFSVGRSILVWSDHKRGEEFTPASEDRRKVSVTAWYPADNRGRKRPDSYWDTEGVTGRAYSINAGMGTFWYSHLSKVKTNSHGDMPVSSASETFPVILYSHSFYGLNTENTMLMEALASSGYVVFSISHPYESIVSLFPEAEPVQGDLTHISERYDSNAEEELELYRKLGHTQDPQLKRSLVRQILKVDELSTQLLRIRTEDVLFVLDRIEDLNQQRGPFRKKLDLSRIGIIGWSFGGATALECCMADQRIKAAINIDGLPYGELYNSGEPVERPFMMIQSDSDDEMEAIATQLLFEQLKNDAFLVRIEDASHTNFWDFPLFFVFYRHLGYWNDIDPLRLSEILAAYSTGFFDRYLNEQELPLWKGPSGNYPEVSIKRSSSTLSFSDNSPIRDFNSGI